MVGLASPQRIQTLSKISQVLILLRLVDFIVLIISGDGVGLLQRRRMRSEICLDL